MTSWNVTQETGGIATLTLDCPGMKLNILSKQVFAELRDALADLASRTGLTGLLLVSAKPDNFVAGANIEEFLLLKTAAEAAEASRQAQGVFRQLEELPFPVVAAVHGPCLGGGLELAMACTSRVASDSPKTTFGALEVKLGLIPGAGGTQRLPRLVGLATALDLNMSGRVLGGRQAWKAGLVEAVVPAESLQAAARQELARLQRGGPAAKRPWSKRVTRWLLEGNPAGRSLLYRGAARELAKAGGHYPAPAAALEAMREGAEGGPAAGYAAESRLFGELAMTVVSRELIRLFFATNDLKRETAGVTADPIPVERLALVGAGFMGTGIAQVAAEVGTSVRLRDVNAEMLGKALAACHHYFEQKADRGRMTRPEAQRAMDRLTVTTGLTGFQQADLVVEAVFEDLEIKHRVVRELEEVLPEKAVLASNTSSIPIASIAQASKRPAQVVGMHFFSPVPKMPLLEVIVTPSTAPWVTATAVAYGKKLGKTVIVVRDGPGFYTSRVLAFYLNEAALMVEEGADIAAVDRAICRFGFPVGPFTLLDEVGLDIGTHVTRVMSGAFGQRLKIAGAFAAVLADGRLGRKNRRGFYTYGKGAKRVDDSVYNLLPGGTVRTQLEPEAIQRRLWLVFASEAVRCLEEGVLQCPRDGDIGAVLGLGFPPFRGGPFRLMDRLGCAEIARQLGELAGRHGERFTPPALLARLAASGGSFHGGQDRGPGAPLPPAV